MGFMPGSGRSPGGGHGKPFQHACLVNPMDRGTWWATVHRVAKSRMQWSTYTHPYFCLSLFKLDLYYLQLKYV